ncbi:hypothetical protein ACE2AJ_10280 [Aquihabitans daechungensis]|uniref:hypothetical protein n=1 Tax=Aquihabitans daechungensis TaxID=1052257 RepID=UPI003BA0AA6D
MNSTTIDMRNTTATVGTAARTRWSATAAAFGTSHHALFAIKPMPSSYVVKNAKGIRHRPPENSS